MGRYLANGVLTSFFIKKRQGNWSSEDFDLKKELDGILKDIGTKIDISKYKMTEHEKCYSFELDLDFLNDNIHELVKEMSQFGRLHIMEGYLYWQEKIDYKDVDFKKNYPLNCVIENDGYWIEGRSKGKGTGIPEEGIFYPFYWILRNCYYRDNVKVEGNIIPIWMDFSKYVGENELMLLRFLNNMKVSYFKSNLSKCLIFEMYG